MITITSWDCCPDFYKKIVIPDGQAKAQDHKNIAENIPIPD